MVDQIFDRDYQSGRSALNGGLDKAFRSLLSGFETLSSIQFAAPWRAKAKDAGCA